jgi:uncharacterized protein YndB with AHSA1/START domain
VDRQVRRADGGHADRAQEGHRGGNDGEGLRNLYQDDAERLWRAITDPAMRAKYSFGVSVYSDWTPGSQYHARATDITVSPGAEIADGENLEVEPPRRLVQKFRALWSDEVKGEGYSRVTWEIEPVGDSCRLTVTHDQLRAGANAELYGGWPMVLSGLKTWLETGETLTTPGSQMYIKTHAEA